MAGEAKSWTKMLKDLFSKPDVVVETDTATPSTQFRVCTFRVTGRSIGADLTKKVRAALQLAKPGCEVTELPLADVREAAKMGARFRMTYYGEQYPGEQVKAAVLKAL